MTCVLLSLVVLVCPVSTAVMDDSMASKHAHTCTECTLRVSPCLPLAGSLRNTCTLRHCVIPWVHLCLISRSTGRIGDVERYSIW